MFRLSLENIIMYHIVLETLSIIAIHKCVLIKKTFITNIVLNSMDLASCTFTFTGAVKVSLILNIEQLARS